MQFFSDNRPVIVQSVVQRHAILCRVELVELRLKLVERLCAFLCQMSELFQLLFEKRDLAGEGRHLGLLARDSLGRAPRQGRVFIFQIDMLFS